MITSMMILRTIIPLAGGIKGTVDHEEEGGGERQNNRQLTTYRE